MKTVSATQYMMPDGRKVQVSFEVEDEIGTLKLKFYEGAESPIVFELESDRKYKGMIMPLRSK